MLRADSKGIFSGMQEDEVEDVEAALRKTQLLPYARRRLTQHSEGIGSRWRHCDCRAPSSYAKK
ncbi:MAG: hypothetical protein U0694_22050 [Anaerolineae bacterium]